VAEVDPDDDSIVRWAVFCHRIDPSVGYRRHVLLAAFDSRTEMIERIETEHARWEAAKAVGEADEREWFSGRKLEIGKRHPRPQPRGRS
jgi:hypothetical protein